MINAPLKMSLLHGKFDSVGFLDKKRNGG